MPSRIRPLEDIDRRNVRPVIFIAYGLEAEEVLYEWYRKVSGLTPGLLTSQQALLLSTKERGLSGKLKDISGIDKWLKVVDLDDKPSIGGAIVEAFANVCSPEAAANARVETWSMDLN